VIGRILYWRARRRPDSPYARYLVAARDCGAWRGIVAGAPDDPPGWLRPAGDPIHEADVRILAGPPARTLLLIDAVEAAAGAPIRTAWPSLRGYIASGESFEPYEALFRRRLGEGVVFVAGRMDSEYALNAFGEQLEQSVLDGAVEVAAKRCGCLVRRYEVEPQYPTVRQSRGRHLWHVEFEAIPADLAEFAHKIDRALSKSSANYRAARAWIREPMVRLVRGDPASPDPV